ncbi:MAG: hypothetical protein GF308_12960 [Candidatus Heimdallarchaeota archaeon]|nr:hypothetical protein [Candidatus Heimdallarchaeota archaeon]
MAIKKILLKNIIKIQEELRLLLGEKSQQRKQLGEFGEIFYQEFDNFFRNGGKRVRPFLIKTAFDAVGGDPEKGNITRASLAIELLHNGSLLHDDVIDHDETRRGKPAFHVVFRELYKQHDIKSAMNAEDFGNAMAIFAGDVCFPYAIQSIITSGFPSELCTKALYSFTEGFREVIDGVIIEVGASIKDLATEEEYQRMIELKTGALIRRAVEIGAILGEGTESQKKALMDYCSHIGKAFQIQDDILGVFGDPSVLGKPVGGDIRESKQTILRIYVMNNGTKEQKKHLSEIMGQENITYDELEKVREIYQESGALDYSQELVSGESQKAIDSLDKATPPLQKGPKKHLIALARYLEERDK